MTAALVMPYPPSLGKGISPPAEATETIDPPDFITLAAAANPHSTPSWLTAISSLTCSGVMSAINA
ncbi:unannotated protein [freshwater metagenome]|uniref:Unannotated protein n=1 Tax=freshwater metagenome TaxID=449393 RepID=A0A6J7LPC8_9ZZZZ